MIYRRFLNAEKKEKLTLLKKINELMDAYIKGAEQ